MRLIDENLKLATLEESSALFNAMRAGDLETFRKLINKNPKLLQWHTNWPTILHHAADVSTVPVVKYLLSLGFDVNENPEAKEGLLYTPLWYACARSTDPVARAQTEAMVRFLVEQGVNVNAGAGQHGTALHAAAFKDSAEVVRYLLEHGADPKFEDEQGRTPLAMAIKFNSHSAAAMLREHGAPLKGIPVAGHGARSKAKSVTVDLRRDAKRIHDYVVKRVSQQRKKSGDPPVKQIVMGFDYGNSGFVSLHFDTRANAEPDGEWTQHIEANELKRPQWNRAAEAMGEKPIQFVLPDGTKRNVAVDDDFGDEAMAGLLGEMLKNVLLSARAEGIFAPLRKAKGCELGVEELEGNYGWPAYEERGKENMA
jgi:hypothetical protein